jgi:hypothetical protein
MGGAGLQAESAILALFRHIAPWQAELTALASPTARRIGTGIATIVFRPARNFGQRRLRSHTPLRTRARSCRTECDTLFSQLDRPKVAHDRTRLFSEHLPYRA